MSSRCWRLSCPFLCLFSETAILIITHQKPDLDALTAAAIVAYLHPQQSYRIIFDSAPDAHIHDARECFIVDVGRTPMDHHQLDDPRSTCAATLVAEHFVAHGTPDQQRVAQALLERVCPSVFRQDTTGMVTAESDVLANLMSLPRIVERLHNRLSDQDIWDVVQPLLFDCFDTEVARFAYKAHIAQTVVWTGERVFAVRDTGQGANGVNGRDARDLEWEMHPTALVRLYEIHHVDEHGQPLTVSRGLGRRPGIGVDCRALVQALLADPTLTEAVHAELAAWYQEAWFCGCGSRKFPAPTPPPDGWLAVVAERVDALL